MEKKNIVLNTKDFNYFKKDKKIVFFYNYILANKRKNIEDVYQVKLSKKELLKFIKSIDYYYKKILNQISKNLNEINKVNKSERYWGIIIGPWIITYIQNMLNMWIEIDVLNKKKNKFKYNFYNLKNISVPNDFNAYETLTQSIEWRSFIYGSIINNYYNKKKFIKKNIFSSTFKDNFDKKKNTFYLRKFSLKFFFFSFLNFFRFTKKKIIFLNTSIGHKKEIICSLKNLTIPFFFFNLRLNPKNNNTFQKERKKLTLGLIPNNDFENFIYSNIPNYFPKSYLEHFHSYNVKIKKDFPKNTKLIISQTIHFGLDIIKFWVANMIESGCYLISLQHGAISGYGSFITNEYMDKKNTDLYSTWGWTNENKKIKKGIFYLRKPKINKKNFLLLVMNSNPTFQHMIRSNLILTNNIELHNFHLNLIKLLMKNFTDKLVVRLPKFHEQKIFYKKEILKINKNVIFDKNIEFLDSLGRAKAVITSYDATPFLQSLNFNTPTIGYWESKYGMINPKMLNYFNDLKKNDILVSNENKINDILIKNFDTIENWWEKSNRLKVINKFRNNFCKDGKFETVFKNDFLKR